MVLMATDSIFVFYVIILTCSAVFVVGDDEASGDMPNRTVIVSDDVGLEQTDEFVMENTGEGSSYRNCDKTSEMYEEALALVNKFADSHSKRTPCMDPNDTGVTTSMEFAFWVSGLLAVDESESDFTIIGGAEFLSQTPVRWDYYDTCGLENLGFMGDVDHTKFWKPLIYSKHLKDFKSLANIPPPIATFYYNGEFTLLPYGYPWMKFTCQFTPTYYPFDTQLCEIDFLIYGQRSTYTNIKHATCYYWEYNRVNIEWDFLACSAELDAPGASRTATISFLLKRRPHLNVLMMVLPAFLLALTNPVIFIIPAQAEEKSQIGLAYLLTFFVFLQSVTGVVPKSVQLPYFSIFLLILLSVNCLALSLAASLLFMKDNRAAKKWNLAFLITMALAEVVLVSGMAAIFANAPRPLCEHEYDIPSSWCVWQDRNLTYM